MKLTDILMLPVDPQDRNIQAMVKKEETQEEDKARIIAQMLNGEICLYCRQTLTKQERCLCERCKEAGKK